MSACRHKSLRSTVVFLEPNALSDCRVAVMTVCCRECGTLFEFVGQDGNRDELRVVITEAMPGMVQ